MIFYDHEKSMYHWMCKLMQEVMLTHAANHTCLKMIKCMFLLSSHAASHTGVMQLVMQLYVSMYPWSRLHSLCMMLCMLKKQYFPFSCCVLQLKGIFIFYDHIFYLYLYYLKLNLVIQRSACNCYICYKQVLDNHVHHSKDIFRI